MKYLLLIALTTGCGALDRASAWVTGDGSDICHDGVLYVQFTSGASVKYKPDGTIVSCR